MYVARNNWVEVDVFLYKGFDCDEDSVQSTTLQKNNSLPRSHFLSLERYANVDYIWKDWLKMDGMGTYREAYHCSSLTEHRYIFSQNRRNPSILSRDIVISPPFWPLRKKKLSVSGCVSFITNFNSQKVSAMISRMSVRHIYIHITR